MSNKYSLLSLFFISALSFAEPPPEDDTWGEEWTDEWEEEASSPWQFSGFTEVASGHFLQNNIVKSASSLNEIRAEFDIHYSHDLFELSAKGDLLYDKVLSDSQWQTRELTLSGSPLEMLDIKLGRQVLTWGTGDYLFLNDLFAKDWQSFFSGRDDVYLKAPSNSIRTTWYVGEFTVDIAWTPEFTPDHYLTGERFSFYSPATHQHLAPAENFKVDQTKNEQWSARLAMSKNGVEYALYGYHGFWPTPQGLMFHGDTFQGIAYFPKLNTFGASIRLPLAEGLFNSEFSLYNSKQDPQGNDPYVANSQFRFLIGYEQELIKNLTGSVQYYLEKTLDYDEFKKSSPTPTQLVDENRQLITLRLRHSAMQQKLISSLFIFYSPTDNDAYLKPSINYRYNDQWSYALGANIFLGRNNFSFFGQHQDNSNAWLRMRYQF